MDSKRYASLKKRVHFYHKVRSIQERAPIIVLLAAAIIGLLTGLVGVAFQYAVQWVIAWRIYITTGLVSSIYLQIIGCFIVSGLMAASAYFLVKHVAPESGGSGIPEIEGALANLRPVRWKRVLPVKFIGGLGALGSGMILGREGPTVQIGGNLGKMVADFFHVRGHEYHHTFIAVGAAAGVTAAFNAPLAGVLFIIEEMRPQFRYNLTSIKAILVGVIMASIMYQCLIDSKPIFNIGYFSAVPVKSLWLYLCLGVIFGGIGVISNKSILACQGFFRQFYQQKPINFLFVGVLLGGTFGILTLVAPSLTGGGFSFIPEAISGQHLFTGLFIIFILRFIGSIICFSSGAPGGIFAPTLALGTIFGVLFGIVMQGLLPDYHIELGACAIIGMGALFASTIRAPLTGIVLVMEMTDNYQLILPMIITCLGSTLMAQMLGGKPLYSEILDGILLRSAKQAYQKDDRDD